MGKITYNDKIMMSENQDIPAENKGRAVDWNEIKNVVNENYDILEENTMCCKPIILFDGSTTTTGVLSENINNFKRLKICVTSSDSHYSTIEIIKEKSRAQIYTSILLGSVSGTTYYGKNARIFIDGTNLSIDRNSEIAIKNNNTSVVSTNDNAIRVYKVIGYYE